MVITSLSVAATLKQTSRSAKNRQPKLRHRSNESSTERNQSTLTGLQQFR